MTELLSWAEECSYGMREWMLRMDDLDAAPASIAAVGTLLPELDCGLLLDPLRDSGFAVPAAAGAGGEGARQQSARMPGATLPREARIAAQVPPVVARNASEISLSLVTLLNSLEARGTDSRYTPSPLDRAKSTDDPDSVQSARGSNAVASAVGVAALKSRPEAALPNGRRSTSSPTALPGGAGVSACDSDSLHISHDWGTALQLPFHIPAQAVAKMYETFAAETERLLTECASNPSVQPSAPACRSTVIMTEILAGMPAPGPSVLANNTPPPPDPLPGLIPAVDRLVETLTLMENRIHEQSASSTTVQQTETAPGEVRWLEDDDLAGRLHGILKRQARRRGIDLS